MPQYHNYPTIYTIPPTTPTPSLPQYTQYRQCPNTPSTPTTPNSYTATHYHNTPNITSALIPPLPQLPLSIPEYPQYLNTPEYPQYHALPQYPHYHNTPNIPSVPMPSTTLIPQYGPKLLLLKSLNTPQYPHSSLNTPQYPHYVRCCLAPNVTLALPPSSGINCPALWQRTRVQIGTIWHGSAKRIARCRLFLSSRLHRQ